MLKEIKRILFTVFLFWAVMISGQTVLIDEDFSGGTLPTDWTNTNNGGTVGQIWEFNNTRGITAGGISGNYAILDSDNYGNGNNQNATLTTPTFSTGIYETITLEFDYQYRDYNGGESCVVEVFDGTSWTEVFRKEFGDENWVNLSTGADLETIDITTETNGSSAAQVRFTYIGVWDYWWAIDNVKVTGTLPSSTNTYLGPGGVGNTDGSSNLVLWLNPDIGVNSGTTWTDQSGYGFDFTGGNGATLNTADVNGHNSYSFDGTSDYFEKSFDATLNPTEFSVFATSNVSSNGSHKALISNRDDPSGSPTRGFILYAYPTSNNWSFWTGRNSGAWQTTGSTTSTTGSWSAQSMFYENTTNGKRLFINNTLNATSTHSMTVNSTQPIRVGAGRNESTPNYRFYGKIGEVIMFDAVLNSAQRIIINNYLSAKYNFSLTSEDYYDEDTTGGNFDFNVAGIGRASDGSLHLDSQGTGIIRINTPSDLNNDEFLFWGEDQISASYDFSSSSSTDYIERLDTKWRVSKRNDLGTVTIAVEESDITLNAGSGCNDLKLIVSNSSTFATKTSYDLTLSSGTYTATGVSFTDGDYFTIEYIDTIVLDATTAYNGAGASNVPNTSDDCYKLLVKSTADGTPSLTENADVREVEIESGGVLVVDSGTRLQVSNAIDNEGDIRLIGTSQLIQTHTGSSQITGSGSLYVDQNSDLTSVYRYNYWTSPVKEVSESNYTIEGVMKDGTTATSATSTPPDLTFTSGYDGSTGPLTLSSYWIYGYLNGSDGSSWSQKQESGTFNPGEGFLLKSPGVAQNYTFVGTPNDGDISFSVDADNTSLLGNPYPSALDANQLFSDSSNLATIYFWEHKNEESTTGNEGHYQSGYIGGYSYRNATMGTAADANVDGTAGLGGGTYTAPGRYIPIAQGFFVETASGLAATINFKNNQRYFETESGDSHFFKSNSKQKDNLNYAILKIGFEAKNTDGIYIHSQVGISFSEGKTFDTEIGFDSKKAEVKESDIYFKFKKDSDKLVIAGVEQISDDLLVPITLKINTADDVFLMLDEKQNITRDVFIFDAIDNIYYNTDKPIKLNLENRIYTNRFYIAFKNETLSLENNIFDSNFFVYQSEHKNIVIKNLRQNTIKEVSLYSIIGQKTIHIKYSNQINNKEIIIDTKNISSSIYILKIHTNQGIVSKKVFLK